MKRLFTFFAALALAGGMAFAQDEAALAEQAPWKFSDGNWTTSTTPALKISEHLFNNWSTSGNSTFDITGTFFGNYKFTNPKYVWDNVVDLAYGYAWQDLEPEGVLYETRRKSNDKIDITSALSWNAYKGWGASLSANLKTQFGNGREYAGIADKEGVVVSHFFAPAYLTTALSFEHKKDNWSVSLSFLTGKTTFVCDDSLILHGYNYGVIQNDKDDPNAPFDISDPSTYKNMKHVYFALGSYVKLQYLKKDLLPNLDLYARFELFYDYNKSLFGDNMGWESIDTASSWATARTKYTGVEVTEMGNAGLQRMQEMNWFQRRMFETDLDFELKLDYRFSQHISANLALNLKYDTDFSGMGWGGHWQLYQMAGVQIFFNWKTPKAE